MELQTAENKIIKILENQNANDAVEEIKTLFSTINFDWTENSIAKAEKQENIEEQLYLILQKFNLNQVAINIFQILEKSILYKV